MVMHMARNSLLLCIICISLFGCASNNQRFVTLASLKERHINLKEPKGKLPISEARAREYYREFLSSTSDYSMYSQALRRLADLQLKVGESKLTGNTQHSI